MVSPDLSQQCDPGGIFRRAKCEFRVAHQVPFHLRPIHDPAARAFRVERGAQDVVAPAVQGWRCQCFEKPGGRPIGQQAVPIPVQHDCSKGQVPIEDELQHSTHVSHLIGGDWRFAKDAGEAGGFEQPVLLTERQAEDLAQGEHRLTARTGTPRFNKTHVPHREAGSAGHLELAKPARLPPGANPRPNRCCCICHVRILCTFEHYLAGNCCQTRYRPSIPVCKDGLH